MQLAQVNEHASQLLAVLAQQGHEQALPARQAYERAMQHLGMRQYPEYRVHADWPRRLDVALLNLDRLHPLAKQLLIEAMLVAVLHDEQMTVQEAELLRTFCACLHYPLPLLLCADEIN
ncbi:MAG: hypothetical protein QM808_10410 [Steroidobacteraceae bacterium]